MTNICEKCGKDFKSNDVFKKHFKQNIIAHKKSVQGVKLCDTTHEESIMAYYCYLDILDNQVVLEDKNVTENLDDMEVHKVINLKITTVKNEITKNVTDVKEKLHRLAKDDVEENKTNLREVVNHSMGLVSCVCGNLNLKQEVLHKKVHDGQECDQCKHKSTKIQHINTHKEAKQEVLKLHTKYLDILDNQVSLEDVIVTDMEVHKVINLKITTVKNEITKNVTDVEEKLDRKEARWRLKRKKDKTQNHGASGQFNLITKRLHNYKMAAKMAAYENWRENTIIIRKDEKMNKCLLLKIHWTMGCLEQRTKLHITWDESKHGNIVKIQNKNGEYSTCQNVDGKYTKFRDKKSCTEDTKSEASRTYR